MAVTCVQGFCFQLPSPDINLCWPWDKVAAHLNQSGVNVER